MILLENPQMTKELVLRQKSKLKSQKSHLENLLRKKFRLDQEIRTLKKNLNHKINATERNLKHQLRAENSNLDVLSEEETSILSEEFPELYHELCEFELLHREINSLIEEERLLETN